MEKGHKELTEATLKEFYRPIVSRMVANYAVRRIESIAQEYPHNDVIFLNKLYNGDFYKPLAHSLDHLWSLKVDAVKEILIQNGVADGELAQLYFDNLTMFLRKAIENMKRLIFKCEFGTIYKQTDNQEYQSINH